MNGKFNLQGIWGRRYIPIVLFAVIFFVPWTQKLFFTVGWRWAYVLSLSFVLSFCLTPVFRWIACRLNMLDRPGGRKLHRKATPLLGSAAVFIAFSAAILINGIYSLKLGAILVGAAGLFAVGFVDDFKEVPAWFKLAVQILCALLVISCGVVLRVVPMSLGIFSLVSNVLLTVFWIVGITNAMNFFDGMDGLAAGLGVIISFFLGVVAFQSGQPLLGWISGAMMGSCIGFLPYNFMRKGKATIFLGDAGSTVIGFILACVAVYGEWAEGNPIVALAPPLLIFWLLIFDMVYITAERIVTGKVLNLRQWVEYVGQDHLHHRLAFVLGGQKKSVLFIYLLSICLGTSAIVLRNARTVDALLLLVQACIIVVLVTILERRGRLSTRGDKNTLALDEAEEE